MSADIGRGGYAVRVIATPADIRALSGAGAPYLTTGPTTGDSGTWTVYAEPRYAPAPSRHWPEYTDPAAGEPGVRLRFSLPDRALVVMQETARWRRQYLIRHVRNLIRRQFAPDGHVFLHAAAVDIGGAGVAVAGRKRAGKTSTLLALLLGAPGTVGLIANDDATLLATGTDTMTLGWPRSVGIRTDSATALEQWSPGLAGRLGIDLAVRDGSGTAHYVDYHTVAAAACVPVVAQRPLRLLVFPQFEPCAPGCTSHGRMLPPEDAYERLVTTGLQAADTYDRFLDSELPADTSADRLARIWPRGAVPVPAFELHQCLHGLQGSAALVTRTVTDVARMRAGR